ncbi:hypothetical protein, partial [Candidatus Methanomassiliicoccus intestinalis]|uniref:hypothetical protein n=1 Tax=Candidatus Methanomassiliicoccus intestinalis TaxID=1406512 RepID=UPI0037DD0B03
KSKTKKQFFSKPKLQTQSAIRIANRFAINERIKIHSINTNRINTNRKQQSNSIKTYQTQKILNQESINSQIINQD